MLFRLVFRCAPVRVEVAYPYAHGLTFELYPCQPNNKMTFQPKQVTRATSWSDQVEEGKFTYLIILRFIRNHIAYRFQLAGYKDQCEYLAVQKGANVSKLT